MATRRGSPSGRIRSSRNTATTVPADDAPGSSVFGRSFSNFWARVTTGKKIRDSQCGFKLYPGNLARALAEVQRIDGFAWDVEHLVIARAWGCRIREVPVHWRHVEASRVHPVRHSTQMLWSLVGLAWRRATGGIPTRPAELA